MSKTDERFMRRALALARKGEGLTSPNPCVGAVLVRGGKVIGEGWHQKAGGPHAEVNAVADAKRRGHAVAGATCYVTLEPCCTHGRTPACTDLLQREKVRRVVAAAVDPNPDHAGRGYTLLRRAGIDVTSGVLADESNALNRDFNHWITTGLPWVVGKIAMSLDGKIALPPGKGRWLTGAKARLRAHDYRWKADAIVIGAETARVDNPRLTVRVPGKKGKVQPWRVVLTRSGRLRGNLHLFQDRHRARTLVFRGRTLRQVLKELGGRGVKNLLIEGGGKILGAALEAGLVNEVAYFVAPLVIGEGPDAVAWPKGGKTRATRVREVTVEKVGGDYLFRGIVARQADLS